MSLRRTTLAWIVVALLIAASWMGYVVGSDMALRDNAAEAR